MPYRCRRLLRLDLARPGAEDVAGERAGGGDLPAGHHAHVVVGQPAMLGTYSERR